MKTNAIIRIIIWSLVLILLISLLGIGLYRPGRRLAEATPAETMVPIPLTEPLAVYEETSPQQSEATTATVTATAVNVRIPTAELSVWWNRTTVLSSPVRRTSAENPGLTSPSHALAGSKQNF